RGPPSSCAAAHRSGSTRSWKPLPDVLPVALLVAARGLDDEITDPGPGQGCGDPDDPDPVGSEVDPLLGGEGCKARQQDFAEHPCLPMRNAKPSDALGRRLRGEGDIDVRDVRYRVDMEFDAWVGTRGDISRADLDERHVRVEDREGVAHTGGRVIVVESHVQAASGLWDECSQRWKNNICHSEDR